MRTPILTKILLIGIGLKNHILGRSQRFLNLIGMRKKMTVLVDSWAVIFLER